MQIARILGEAAAHPDEVRHHYAHTRFRTLCDPLMDARRLAKRRRTR